MADQIEQYKALCGLLHDALREYANPEFYFAIAIIPDRPAGGFADDLDDEHGCLELPGFRPGKLARETLAEAHAQFGEIMGPAAEQWRRLADQGAWPTTPPSAS